MKRNFNWIIKFYWKSKIQNNLHTCDSFVNFFFSIHGFLRVHLLFLGNPRFSHSFLFLRIPQIFFSVFKILFIVKRTVSIALATQPCITVNFYHVLFCRMCGKNNLFIHLYPKCKTAAKQSLFCCFFLKKKKNKKHIYARKSQT